MVRPVILAGGGGTRLWPLSRRERPKQFLPLLGEETLFQQTLLRLNDVSATSSPIVVCNEEHRFLVAEQLREINVTPLAIVLEPAGRNTAPAIAVAALLARSIRDRGPASILLVLPADHMIGDQAAFATAIGRAVEAAAAGRLVTFGIVPSRPETGYGYLKHGTIHDDGWAVVERFVEKPDLVTAERYVESGEYLWNSGMFAFGTEAFLAELGRHEPEILAACERAVAEAGTNAGITELGAAFLASPSNSIDYAVMEKTDAAVVVPLDAGWNDVGSWAALHDVSAHDEQGNVLLGDVISDGCTNSYIRSESRFVAAFGLEDIVVIEVGDAVLVMRKQDSQKVKLAVDLLQRRGETGPDDG